MMKKKILIVDDEPGVIDFLAKALTAVGYDVISAGNGATGLNKAQQESPDLIILDVMLPDINGFSICGVLKGNEKYKSIPVIILTGRDEANDQIFDEAYKPEAFLNKPFDFDHLLGIIQKFVGKAK